MLRNTLKLLLLTCCVVIHGEALLFPLLFPLSIKITFHSNHKPAPPPLFHFEAQPVYREVVVKGSAHISPPKQSYGNGPKYGTSYGNGHVKVYTQEPHIRGHKHSTGYQTGTGGSIDGHFSISSYPETPSGHYKGSPYDSTGGTHYKGAPYPQTVYKGTGDASYSQDSPYGEEIPSTHYKGTVYDDQVPPTHYKGTEYDEKAPPTHYKGTSYEEETPTHYKGSPYDDVQVHYKGSSEVGRPKLVYKPYEHIKAVGGGYKISDYISDDKTNSYPDDDSSYVAIPPGKTYAEYEAAHKAARAPTAYPVQQYPVQQYPDRSATRFKKEYEHGLIDDSLPVYKANIPKPRQRPQYRYQSSASRFDRVPLETQETTAYAGFGSSIYGDSYAKIVYVPRNLRISIRAYSHK